MRDTLKVIGGVFVWILALVCLWLIGVLIIKGGVWLTDKLYPWLLGIALLSLLISVFCFLPSAALKETRLFAGVGLLICSYVFGALLWAFGFLVTYNLWGIFGLVIGLMLFGVGVVPIAILATLFKGMWSTLGLLILGLFAVYGTRSLSGYFAVRAEQESYETAAKADAPKLPMKLIISSWSLFAASFVPFLGWVTIIPYIVCSIILCCSKARRARRHGQVLLSLLLILAVVLALVGYYFYDRSSGVISIGSTSRP